MYTKHNFHIYTHYVWYSRPLAVPLTARPPPTLTQNSALTYLLIMCDIHALWPPPPPTPTQNSALTSLLTTVNVDIFAQLNFRASSPRCYFHMEKFSRIMQLILFSLLWFIFSRTSYFCACNSNTLCEMCENMYCAQISTFTVCAIFATS